MARGTNYSAPVAPLDHEWSEADNEVHPCAECLPWYAEVLVHPDGHIVIREWHAVGCPTWEIVEHFEKGEQ